MIKKSVLITLLLICSISLKAQKWTFGATSSKQDLMEGIENYDEGKYSAALKKFEKIHVNDTNYASAIYEKIITLTELKEYDKGITVAEEGIALNNEYLSQYYNALGTLYDKMDSGALSLEVYDKAIAMFPRDYRLVYNKAVTLKNMERYEESVKLAQELIRQNPFYATPHYFLGRLCAEQGLYTQSIMSLTNFLIVNPAGAGSLDALKLLENVSTNSVDFDEPEEDKEKEKLARRDISFMNEGYEEMDNIIENQVNVTKKYKTKSKLDFALIKQVHYMMHNRKSHQTEGFWAEYYGPYFDKIIEDNSYAKIMMIVTYLAHDQAYLTKNNKTIIPTYKNNIKDYREMYCIMDITLDGKTVSKEHHFSGPYIEGVGEYKNDKPIGEWTYFYNNGNVSGVGSWNDKNQREGKWLWYFPNGVLKEENVYENGKLQGPLAMYFEEGTPSYKTSFKDGEINGDKEYYAIPGHKYAVDETNEKKKVGMFYYYYPNGQISYEAHYKNGEIDGAVKRYFEDGSLKEELTYKSGKKEGILKTYNVFGVVTEEENYSDGLLDGKNTEYFEDGTVKIERYYTKGNIKSRKEYFRNGQIQESSEYKDGELNELFEVYDDDGKIHYNIKYAEGKPQNYKCFDKSGGIIKSGKLKKREMVYYGFFPTGEKRVVGTFSEGDKEGTWKYYSKTGFLQNEEKFQKGQLHGIKKSYHANGELNSSTKYSYGNMNGKFESYYSNGKMYAEGYYKYGKRNGEWRFYEADGKLKSKYFYESGTQRGTQKFYDADGKVYQENECKDNYVLKKKIYNSNEKLINEFDLIKNPIEKQLYPNGKVRKEASYKNCLLNDKITWYFPDGSLEVKGQYNNAERIGEWTSNFPDGKLSSTTFYKQGEKDSTWIYYFYNGKIKNKYTYKNGVEYGTRESYYSNGTLKSTTTLIGGERHGNSLQYNKDGVLAYTKLYKNDRFEGFINVNGDTSLLEMGEKEYVFNSKDGKKLAVINTKNGKYHGVYKMFYSNGKVQREYPYTEGNYNGILKDYYSNGSVEESSEYFYGDLHGNRKFYYSNGKIRESADFKKNNYYGERTVYSESGSKIVSLEYYNDIIIGEKK